MEGHIKFARALTDVLDNKFSIGKLHIGLDALLGFIPGFGDIITTILSLYLVWIGIQLKMPQDKITQMVGNVITDFIIGILPLVGDIGDIFFRSNSKNMAIIEEYVRHGRKVVEAEVIK